MLEICLRAHNLNRDEHSYTMIAYGIQMTRKVHITKMTWVVKGQGQGILKVSVLEILKMTPLTCFDERCSYLAPWLLLVYRWQPVFSV